MKKITRLAANLALGLILTITASAVAADTQPQKSPLNSALDIQEDDTNYSVRLAIPETTDVNVRLAGSTLILDSGASVNGIRHEQRVTLPKAQPDAALGIKRAGGQLVISIPKGDSRTAGAILNLPSDMDFDAGFDALRNQVLSQAAGMLQQMSKDENSADETAPAQNLFGSILGSIAPQLQIGSSGSRFQLEDRSDAYVLTSALTEEQARNVSVNVDNERRITITSKHEKQSSTGGSTALSSTSSTQSMTLPGPVRGEELKMDYKNGRLEIILPKK